MFAAGQAGWRGFAMQPMMSPGQRRLPADAALLSVPLVTLYLTERCNSRCVSCDYWRHGRLDMTLESVAGWVPGLLELGTQVVLVSGGEPLLHPQWVEMARLLKSHGLKLWLLSSGLSLARHAVQVCELFESVTVSLDGCGPETYAAIRGLDAFDAVCNGIRSVARLGLRAGLRVTVQRANYRELPEFVALAHSLGAKGISFLAADLSNPHAFGRKLADGFAADIALQADDLPEFEAILDRVETNLQADFQSGFIAESPRKLRRIAAYYRAVCGFGEFPAVRCNAPEFSAVVEASGRLRPCFFIPGPGSNAAQGLPQALNTPAMQHLRVDIRSQRRAECARCVCHMWRDPQSMTAGWGGRA